MREVTVAMVMTKDPITVTPGTGFKDIAEMLTKHSISAVPVVSADGVPIGVVSEADLTVKQEQPEPPSFLAHRHARRAWLKANADRAVDLMTVPETRSDIEHEVFQRVLWADLKAITVEVRNRLDCAWNDQPHN